MLAIGMLTFGMAMQGGLSNGFSDKKFEPADPKEPVEPEQDKPPRSVNKLNKPKELKHPFNNVSDKLYTMMLDAPFMNATDMAIFKRWLLIPMELIPLESAVYIVSEIEIMSRRSFSNCSEFDAPMEYDGRIYDVKIVAMNEKNAKKKIFQKMELIKNCYEQRS